MRAQLTLVLASMLVLAPIVVAQEVYVADEPNVASVACIPTAPSDPSRCAVDNNGIATARDSGALILQTVWNQVGFGDYNELLEPLTGKQWLVGAGFFDAWHGTWVDADGDGAVRLDTIDLVVDARDADPLEWSVDLGDAIPYAACVQGGADPLAGCSHAEEWSPVEDESVVLYVTPGNFNDVVNGPIGLEGGGTVTASSNQPDYLMVHDDNGRYIGPSAGFEQIWVDNGLLQTTITETISNPNFDPSQARSHNAGTGSLTDADLYTSVDPTLEGAYETATGGIWYNPALGGVNPDLGWSPLAGKKGAFASVGSSAAGTTVGPEFAKIVPKRAQDFPIAGGVERTIADYQGQFETYLNIWIDEATGYEGGIILGADVASQQFSPNANGKAGTLGYFGIYAAVGAWNDKNFDGWIGDAPDACGDGHACGTVQDPNNYFAARSGGEFFEVCADMNPSQVHYFNVTLTPMTADGSWGSTGIYVLKDRYAAAGRDRGAEGPVTGYYSYHPWDDIVWDPVSDGSVDNYVTSGPIQAYMTCTDYSGTPYYTSWQHFVLPGGTRDYGIRIESEPVDVQFAGLDLQDFLVDVDEYPHA